MNTHRAWSRIGYCLAPLGLAAALPAAWTVLAPGIGPRPVVASPPPRGDTTPPRTEIARPAAPRTTSGEVPDIKAHEFLEVNGRRVPLYGPMNSHAGLASDWSYAYLSTPRVASAQFDAASDRLDLTLAFNPPETALAEAKARIEAKASAHVTLVPIPIRRYEIAIRDTGSGQEHTWAEDAGGDSGEILPPPRKVISWKVPEDLKDLRYLLAKRPQAFTVRVRLAYNFQAIARGVVRTGVAGVVNEMINEEVHPVGSDRTSTPLTVSRAVADQILSKLDQSLVIFEENSGLEPEEWEKARGPLTQVVSAYFKSLPAENLGAVLDAIDQRYIYQVVAGRVESSPLISKSKILQQEHEEDYRQKAKGAVKTIKELDQLDKDDRKFHSDLKDRMKLDASISGSIVGIGGGSADFHLEKESSALTDNDLKQIHKKREYFREERDWDTEIARHVKDKIQGELIAERAQAKSIDIVRIDRRELSRRVGAVGEVLRRGEFQEVVIQSETNLDPSPDDDHDADMRELAALKASNVDLRARVEGFEKTASRNSQALPGLLDRCTRHQAKIRALEADRGGLEAQQADAARSLDAASSRMVAAYDDPTIYDLIAWRHACSGMTGIIPHLEWLCHFSTPLSESENRKSDLKVAIAKESMALSQRDSAVNAEKAKIRAGFDAYIARAGKLDKIRAQLAAERTELDSISAELSSLIPR